MIIEAREIICDETSFAPGWIEIVDDRIDAVGGGRPPSTPDHRFPNGLVAPGYVDVHAHGGGGASFSTTSDEQIDRVLATHLTTGTTTMVASLVTATPDDLRAQVACLAKLFHAGDIAGIHLEGPWLSPAFKGAHDESLLLEPRIALMDELITLGQGAIAMVTIAPELPGSLEAIRFLTEHKIVAAIGHTNCSYDQARAAIDAGARGATHLFNAMAPLHHRQPGPVLALLRDPRVYVEIVFDGVHLHPDLAGFALDHTPSRGVLVTDAMAAAGQADGRYLLGELDVDVRDGVARLPGADTIAGSTLRLDSAVRNAVRAGISPSRAIRAATANPADYLALPAIGRLKPGFFADLVLLDDELNVQRTMRHGRWVSVDDRRHIDR